MRQEIWFTIPSQEGLLTPYFQLHTKDFSYPHRIFLEHRLNADHSISSITIIPIVNISFFIGYRSWIVLFVFLSGIACRPWSTLGSHRHLQRSSIGPDHNVVRPFDLRCRRATPVRSTLLHIHHRISHHHYCRLSRSLEVVPESSNCIRLVFRNHRKQPLLWLDVRFTQPDQVAPSATFTISEKFHDVLVYTIS